MCGRFVRSFSTAELIDELERVSTAVSVVNAGLAANYNVAPSTLIDVLYCSDRSLQLDAFQWGFVNSMSTKESGSALLINARSETAHVKPTFRSLVAQQRCLIPMDGFYEWQRNGPKPVPYFVSRSDGNRMWVGGLYRQRISQTQQPAGQKSVAEVVLLTKNSLPDLSHIHDRSPVHLQLSDGISWLLDTSKSVQDLQACDPPVLQSWSVSIDVNSVRNNRPDLTRPVEHKDIDQQPSLFD
jgi:putative SOS response-associated peptidase YedK